MTAFTLKALLELDKKGFDDGLKSAESTMGKFGNGLKAIGSGIAKVGKVAAAATVAAGAAIGKIAMSSVQAYSNYEQLVGGVETLFGTSTKSFEAYKKQVGITNKSTQKEIDKALKKYNSLQKAQKTVMENAHKAFKTAGVDANTYMETVTSFSASLLQSVKNDTVKAAEIADMAMIDMADNANKMGTDMSAIQNAYQGFAKQNYTMLDNLKLGYGGTRTEMQRLLKDAEAIMKKNGENVKYSINNLSDVYEAIHVVQTEMGITGTTAEEAQKTIQGSTQMMKAAWNNLKIAIVDPNGNIPQAISDLTDSVKAAAKNWLPAIKQALSGIGQVIKDLAPLIATEFPALISEVLPDLLEAITTMLPALVEAAVTIIPAIVKAFIDNIDLFIDAAKQIFNAIIDIFKESDSPVLQLIGKALEGIKEVAGFVLDLIKDFPGAIQKLKDSDSPILQFLGGALETIESVFNWIIENYETVALGIGAIITAMAAAKVIGFIASLSPLTLILAGIAAAATLIITNWDGIQKFFEDLWSAITQAASLAWAVISEWWGNIERSVSEAWESISSWFSENVWTPISEAFTSMWDAIVEFWNNPLQSIEDAWTEVSGWLDTNVWTPISDAFTSLWDAIVEFWNDPLGSIEAAWTEVASWLDTNVWTPISSVFTSLWEAVQEFWNDPLGSIEAAWKTVSSWLDENVWTPITTFFTAMFDGVKAFWDDPAGTIEAAWKSVSQWVEDNVTAPITEFFGNVKQAIQDAIDKVGEIIDEIANIPRKIVVTVTRTIHESVVRPVADAIDDIVTGGAEVAGGAHGFAKGEWNVPYDMPALLHRNEMVLTASQARRYREDEGGMDYRAIGKMIGSAVESAMSRVMVIMSGEKVGNLTTEQVRNNINAESYSMLRAMGG